MEHFRTKVFYLLTKGHLIEYAGIGLAIGYAIATIIISR